MPLMAVLTEAVAGAAGLMFVWLQLVQRYRSQHSYTRLFRPLMALAAGVQLIVLGSLWRLADLAPGQTVMTARLGLQIVIIGLCALAAAYGPPSASVPRPRRGQGPTTAGQGSA